VRKGKPRCGVRATARDERPCGLRQSSPQTRSLPGGFYRVLLAARTSVAIELGGKQAPPALSTREPNLGDGW